MSYPRKMIAVLAVAILVRLIQLNGSFWLDEAAQALESARPFSQQLAISGDFQPPLYHIVVHFWMSVGKSEWWLRLASVIPGLITIWLVMQLGKKLWNESTGLIAGLLLATSQFHVFYSQELRPYSLATMWALLALYYFYLMQEKKRFAWIGFLVSGIGGLYSMYVFPVFLLALLCMVFVYYRSQRKQIVVLMMGMAIGFIPWLPKFIEQLQVGTTLSATMPAWNAMVSPPLLKMLPLTAVKFLLGRILVDFTIRDLLMIGSVGLASLVLLLYSLKQKNSRITAIWVGLPIIFAFLISIKIPVLDPKRVMFCLPCLYLLLAAGFNRQPVTKIALAILLSINTLSLFRYAIDTNQQREPWRQAVQTVEAVSQAGDKVVFPLLDSDAPWVWYQKKNHDVLSAKNLATQLNGAQQVFVFDYLSDLADPQHQIWQQLEQAGYTETSFTQYHSIGKVRKFSIK